MQGRFETFTLLINRISRNVRRIKNQEMADYNLKGVHVSCLYYLWSDPGLTATDLVDRCEEDKATISRAIAWLEDQGYILPRGAAKRYNCPLELTPKGREAGAKIGSKIAGVLEEINDSLTEQERLSFYRSLSLISGRLEEVAARR